jgi:thiol-disulfide isomerase/thioredoxin
VSLANRLHVSGRTPLLSLMMMVVSGAVMWHLRLEDRQLSPTVEILQVAQPPDIVFFKDPVPLPDFPAGLDWINTNSRLKLSDLRGKLVLLDFWTYCCINCMHVLPVLDEVEKKYDKQLIVVGVHAAKFETEKDTENIREAIQRYEIRHPVLNDANHLLWNQLQINSWPTLVLIDPQGRAIWAHAGEIEFENLDRVVQRAVAFYEGRKEIDNRS